MCCSQDIKSSHGFCKNQGQARYTRSARARAVTMCQNQGQAIYTRSATTRIVAIKLDMPNPSFALAQGLCTQANSYQGDMGAATTFFPFKILYRPRPRTGRSGKEK